MFTNQYSNPTESNSLQIKSNSWKFGLCASFIHLRYDQITVTEKKNLSDTRL